MPDKFFLDTNIIVYSFDQRYPEKRNISRKLIRNAFKWKNGIISYQVIQEFINVALKKFTTPLKPEDCKYYIDKFLVPICKISPTFELYHEAIDIKEENKIGFYDAIIVASAIKGKSEILYSEDLSNGQKIRSVQIINPFKDNISDLF